MPALTMRGRYLLREFWTDSVIARKLDAEQRLIYIGLWMLADDGGWLPRDLESIAAQIFPFSSPEVRRSTVEIAIDRLRRLGKVTSTRCCLHVGAVERYPRPGLKSYVHRDAHTKHQSASKRINGQQTETIDNDVIRPDPTLPNPTLPSARAAAREGQMTPIGEAQSKLRERWGKRP